MEVAGANVVGRISFALERFASPRHRSHVAQLVSLGCLPFMPSSQSESVENRLKQLHEYNRHIAQLIIAWFTFFVTANCAVMGWLLVTLSAAKQTADSRHPIEHILPLIVALFALENILGICACLVVRGHFLRRAALAHKIEASLFIPDPEGSLVSDFQTVPVDLYSKALWLMTIALIFLLLAWCSLLFIF